MHFFRTAEEGLRECAELSEVPPRLFLAQVEALIGKKVDRVIEVNSPIDAQQPLMPQLVAMADQRGLSPTEWQTLPILVNPPSLHWVAVTLLAEIHGPCGWVSSFPPASEVGGRDCSDSI